MNWAFDKLSQKHKFVKVKQNIKQEVEVPVEVIQIYDLDEDEDMVLDKTPSSTSTLEAVPSKKGFKTTSLNKSSTKSNLHMKINTNHVGSGGDDGDGGIGSKKKETITNSTKMLLHGSGNGSGSGMMYTKPWIIGFTRGENVGKDPTKTTKKSNCDNNRRVVDK